MKPPEPRPVSRFYCDLLEGQQFSDLLDCVLAVSPDGRQIVYSTTGGLYLRSIEKLEARLLEGAGTGAVKPFFSPDGKWIGYFSKKDGQLKKIAVSGGAPVAITAVNTMGSFDWGADGKIVYGQLGGGIFRVSADGGTPEAIVDVKSEALLSPQILPGGDSVLFTSISPLPLKVMVQSLKSGARKELFEGDTARYLPTGHIVYAFDNDLLAVPFDLAAGKVAGEPVSLVEGVSRAEGAPQYAVSSLGTLVYIQGKSSALGTAAATSRARSLMWVDRNGKEEPIAAPPRIYSDPRISPDGRRLTLGVTIGGGRDVWIWDLLRETLTRRTFDTSAAMALWTSDGKRFVFHTDRKDAFGTIYWQAADGGGKDELFLSVPGREVFPSSWSSDGMLLAMESSAQMAYNIGAVSSAGRKWRPLLQQEYAEAQPEISPDGRWMAYTSNESGEQQIYVRPFPGVDGGRWQVSNNGGNSPLWSPDGRELFYRSGDAVASIEINAEPAFGLGKTRILFRGKYVSANFDFGLLEFHPWDISRDGERFLMMKEIEVDPAAATETPRRINVVLNWTEELKQRVPRK